MQQDFSHAQSLTTDAYRPQLIAQQQAVRKAGATKNEYWAVSSAVLSAPQDRTTRRCCWRCRASAAATPKDLKFITATVRVDFDKSRDGQWRVANLIRAEEAADESRRANEPAAQARGRRAGLLPMWLPKPPRRWGLPTHRQRLATLLIAAGITAKRADADSAMRRTTGRRSRKPQALGYVREFMTAYTTLDPFHANDYADRILAQGTGDFAKMFKEKENEILIQVARAEPTTGTVLESGRAAVERQRQRRRAGRDEDLRRSRRTGSRRSRAETVGLQRLSRKDSSGRSAS